MSLFTHFQQISDPRRQAGLRTSLASLLTMATVGYLCGKNGYRAVARFCKANEPVFKALLGLRHPVPSHVTFTNVMSQLNERELIDCFNSWTSEIGLSRGDWVSADGKTLGSTLVDPHGSGQDYQAVVSFFAHQKGLVYLMDRYQNKAKSQGEPALVRTLLDQLKGMGLTICMDAQHSPQKQPSELSKAEITM